LAPSVCSIQIHRLERTPLPRRDLGVNGIGDGADEVRRHLHDVHLAEKGLDLAQREAAGVQRQNRVVEAGEPPLVFPGQLRLEGPVAIARDIQRERPSSVRTVLPLVPSR
jgi:hypothetical protein